MTHIQASIANPARPQRNARLKFLVDSGAMYSVFPASVLWRFGIKPGKTKTFILADGTEIKRSLGDARFRINGEEGTSPVIFGEEGDSILLGSISLEVVGFILGSWWYKNGREHSRSQGIEKSRSRGVEGRKRGGSASLPSRSLRPCHYRLSTS